MHDRPIYSDKNLLMKDGQCRYCLLLTACDILLLYDFSGFISFPSSFASLTHAVILYLLYPWHTGVPHQCQHKWALLLLQLQCATTFSIIMRVAFTVSIPFADSSNGKQLSCVAQIWEEYKCPLSPRLPTALDLWPGSYEWSGVAEWEYNVIT